MSADKPKSVPERATRRSGVSTPIRTPSPLSTAPVSSHHETLAPYESTPLLGTAPSRTYTPSVQQSHTAGPSQAAHYHGNLETDTLDLDDEIMFRPRAPSRPRQSIGALVTQRSKYYIPVLDWLAHYDFSTFGGDLIAGLTVACLIIPQSMSYASSLAHLPPVAGLWSTAIPGLVYSMLGTCRQLSVGPEAALSLLVGQMVTEIIEGDPHSVPQHPEKVAIQVAIIITMQVGLFTFFLGICRLGFLDVVLSRALLRGFITAIAIIILIEQLVPMLGLNAILQHGSSMHPIDKLTFVVQNIGKTNIPTAILSAIALSVLIGAKSIKQYFKDVRALRYIPEIFLTVVISTILTGVLRLDHEGVAVLGKLEGGLHSPFGIPFRTSFLQHFRRTLPTAAVIAVVGYVDSIVAAKENSAKFGYAISPNREVSYGGPASSVRMNCALTM